MDDIKSLGRALEEVYAPRVFSSDSAWGSFRDRLEALVNDPKNDPDRNAFCEALGSALTYMLEPSLFAALDDSGPRCVRVEDARESGLPHAADRTGTNVAAGASALYALRMEPGPAPIAVLGIRRFEPSSAPEWAGLPRAIASATQAAALVLDLRGAQGSDPSALLPLIASLIGGAELHPLREIHRAENTTAWALRRAYEQRFGPASFRPASVWQSLTGAETEVASKKRIVRVLVGEGCEEACELVARVLQVYAGAVVDGKVGSERRLSVGEPGLLVLPRSGIRVHIPTAAYVLNERIGRATGDRGAWFDRWNFGQVSSYDSLTSALEGCRAALDHRARLARWQGVEPRPCATYPAIDSQEALPAGARARVSGFFIPGKRQEISVLLDLSVERATKYVGACPGIEGLSGYDFDGATSILVNHVDSFAALSRLAQSEAVRSVTVRISHPPKIEPWE